MWKSFTDELLDMISLLMHFKIVVEKHGIIKFIIFYKMSDLKRRMTEKSIRNESNLNLNKECFLEANPFYEFNIVVQN